MVSTPTVIPQRIEHFPYTPDSYHIHLLIFFLRFRRLALFCQIGAGALLMITDHILLAAVPVAPPLSSVLSRLLLAFKFSLLCATYTKRVLRDKIQKTSAGRDKSAVLWENKSIRIILA